MAAATAGAGRRGRSYGGPAAELASISAPVVRYAGVARRGAGSASRAGPPPGVPGDRRIAAGQAVPRGKREIPTTRSGGGKALSAMPGTPLALAARKPRRSGSHLGSSAAMTPGPRPRQRRRQLGTALLPAPTVPRRRTSASGRNQPTLARRRRTTPAWATVTSCPASRAPRCQVREQVDVIQRPDRLQRAPNTDRSSTTPCGRERVGAISTPRRRALRARAAGWSSCRWRPTPRSAGAGRWRSPRCPWSRSRRRP